MVAKRASLVTIAVALCLGTGSTTCGAEPELLRAGFERTVAIDGPTVARFAVDLEQQGYLHLVVEQEGVDVSLVAKSPDDAVLLVADSPNHLRGPEPLHLLATEGGHHIVEVRHEGPESGAIHVHVSTLRSARPRDRQAVEAQALFLGSQSRLYSRPKIGRLRESGAGFIRALSLFRELGDVTRQSQTLHALGLVHGKLGEPAQASPYLRQALELRRALGDQRGETRTLNCLGSALRMLGQNEEAAQLLARSLAQHEEDGDRLGAATAANNLAGVYLDLGRLHRAFETAQRAVEHARAAESLEDHALGEKLLGAVFARLHDDRRAVEHLERARSLFIESDIGSPGELTTDSILATIQARQGNFEAAVAHFERALPGLATTHRYTYAQALVRLGKLLPQLGRTEEAISRLEEAIALSVELETSRIEGRARTALATIELPRNPVRCRALLERALGVAEAAADPIGQIRARTVLSELEAREGNTQEALVQARAGAALALSTSGFEDAWSVQRSASEVRSAERAESLNLAVDRARLGHAGDRRPVLQALIGALLERGRGNEEVLAEAFEVAELARTVSPAMDEPSAVREPVSPGDGTPRPALDLLDGRTTYLALLLGPNRSTIWRVDRSGLRVAMLPGRNRLEVAARRLLERLAVGDEAAAQEPARQLGRTLLGQIGELPEEGRLLWAADGELTRIPLALLGLPDESSYTPVVERFEIAHVASLSELEAIRRRSSSRSRSRSSELVVVANPAYPLHRNRAPQDGRQSDNCSGRVWSRLPGSAKEAAAVIEGLEAAAVTRFEGLRATTAALTSDAVRRAGLIHVAAHAFFDSESPILGGLVLLDPQNPNAVACLTVGDAYELELRADLVTLSACDTALGSEGSGTGVLGLPRALLASGASAVTASLWKARDEATATLMTDFYRELGAGLDPAAALRAAQRSALSDPQRRSATLWAGFVLLGDWRANPLPPTKPLTTIAAASTPRQ